MEGLYNEKARVFQPFVNNYRSWFTSAAVTHARLFGSEAHTDRGSPTSLVSTKISWCLYIAITGDSSLLAKSVLGSFGLASTGISWLSQH